MNASAKMLAFLACALLIAADARHTVVAQAAPAAPAANPALEQCRRDLANAGQINRNRMEQIEIYETENSRLRVEVADLQKQIADLRR